MIVFNSYNQLNYIISNKANINNLTEKYIKLLFFYFVNKKSGLPDFFVS